MIWLACLALIVAGCATQRPVLYPNAKLQGVGNEAAQRDIDECIRLAEQYGVTPGRDETVARGAGGGAAVGGATGAVAGAIGGRNVLDSAARGAAVVGLDLNPAIATLHQRPDFLGIHCDVTSEASIRDALESGVQAFGGLDMLVLNAGIFPAGTKLSELTTDEWRWVMRVNLDANFVLLRECHALLRLAPR